MSFSFLNHNKNKKNEEGIALVLAVLVLANLFIITFIVTDIVLRIGKGSHQIGQSEIAYFAAEASIEDAVYTIESTRDITSIGTEQDQTTGSLDYTDGTWNRYSSIITSLSPVCVDSEQKVTYPSDPDSVDALDKSCVYAEDIIGVNNNDISNSNPLKIRLKDGQSFSFDLDIVGLNYPDYVTVTWEPSDADSQLVVVSETEQQVNNTSEAGFDYIQVPSTGSLNSSPHRIRFINQNGSDITYTIEPSLSSFLPVGVLVHGQGLFSNSQERIIEVERKNWQIY